MKTTEKKNGKKAYWGGRRRCLAVLISLCLVGTTIPITARAEEAQTATGLCEHHTAHTPECGYLESSEGNPGTPCGYACDICTKIEEPSKSDISEAVKKVQDLIDALPEADDITKENYDAVAERLDEIDEARLALSDEEMAQLSILKWKAAVAKMEELVGGEPDGEPEMLAGGSETAVMQVSGKGLRSSIIGNPTPLTSDKTTMDWSGSYVYFGKYNGNSVKYRVLDKKTTNFTGTTMFLDCDSVLWSEKFDASSNIWSGSSIKTKLNGSDFLTNSSCFTSLEQGAIAASTINAHSLSSPKITYNWAIENLKNYVALSNDKIFLLDGEDVLNGTYGYCDADKAKSRNKGSYSSWWLRSARSPQYKGQNAVGRILYYSNKGEMTFDPVSTANGVSPAMNIDLSKVLFSTPVSGEQGAYKLTLLNNTNTSTKVGVTGGSYVVKDGSKITIPYTISNATDINRISVMVTDKAYTDATASLKYYGTVLDGAGNISANASGTAVLTLPTGITWNSGYKVYLIAEKVNGAKESDEAYTPYELTNIYCKITVPNNITNGSITATAPSSLNSTDDGNDKYYYVPAGTATASFKVAGNNGYIIQTLKVDGKSVDKAVGSASYSFKFSDVQEAHKIEEVAFELGASSGSDSEPTITSGPVDQTVTEGNDATFTIEASGNPDYQWIISTDGGTSWRDISNATQASYTISAVSKSDDASCYKCIVSNNAGWVVSKTATLTVEDAPVPPAPPVPVSSGGGSSSPGEPYRIFGDGAEIFWRLGSGEDLTVRGSGAISKFAGVKLDGEVIDESNYTVTEGSTIVALKASYLNTLAPGPHKVEIVWADGSATAAFTVLAAEITPDISGNNIKDSVPKTGDTLPAVWLLLLSLLSGAGLVFSLSGLLGSRISDLWKIGNAQKELQSIRKEAAMPGQYEMQFDANGLPVAGISAVLEDIYQSAQMGDAESGKSPPDILPKYRELHSINPDMAGWLAIDDTLIDYPIMQKAGDENYYLEHDFYGKQDKNGCLILDEDSAAGTGTRVFGYQNGSPPSTNLLIHGHTMKSGKMFGKLSLYEEKEYGMAHNILRFDSLYEEREYKLIAAFYSQVYYEKDDVFKYYKFFRADTQAEFDNWYQNIKKLSLYDTGVTAQLGDEFLTLSCCSYQVEDGRFVVVAKRIR